VSSLGVAREFLVFMGLALAFPAAAQTSQTLVYDALGRLTEVQTVPGSGAAQASRYGYDAAGNRTARVVTGGEPGQGAASRIIVVPLNGFTIIPIGASPASSSNRVTSAPPIVQELPYETDAAREGR
jgi:YD repeat-containing protein